MAASAGSGQLGRDISLAALRRHDPYIRSILDVASQVALYTFSHKANEWEKTDVEGTLFVYSRSASPKHGFTIMNRLSMENRTEPITKDLEFQLQDPFLLYRNARLLIYGIWFYNKEECQRIAELMKNLTKQEQEEAQQAASVSPMMLPSEGKAVDILKMLNRAKDEYTKCKPSSEPKKITNSSAIHSNPNLIKPIAVKACDTSSQSTNLQHSKPGDPEPQHLSLTTLFGKPEKTLVEGTEHKEPSAPRPGVVRSLSYEDPSRLPEMVDKQLCPAIQKLLVRGADLLPVSEVPENQNGSLHMPGDVFSSLFLSVEDVNPLQEPDNLLHKLSGLQPEPIPATHCHCTDATNTPGKMAANDLINLYDNSPQNQRTPSNLPMMPLTSQVPMPSGTLSPQELLQKLKLVRQDQQCHASSKPTLAAKFPAVSQTSVKPLGERPNPLLQVISPQRIPATVSPSLLLSPLVFTQSAQKSADVNKPLFSEMDPMSNRLLPPSLTNAPNNDISSPSNALTKSQLCDTLIHLIQNDDGFMKTIYETYLTVVNTRGKF